MSLELFEFLTILGNNRGFHTNKSPDQNPRHQIEFSHALTHRNIKHLVNYSINYL